METSLGKPSVDLSKYVRPGLKLSQVQSLKECFDIFDDDLSGIVSTVQLKNAIVSLGMAENADKILQIVDEHVHHKDLDFGAFLQIFGYSGDLGNESTLTQVFAEFDIDKKGHFDAEDLARVCANLGENFTEDEIKDMISAADDDKDGGLTFREFSQVIKKQYSKV